MEMNEQEFDAKLDKAVEAKMATVKADKTALRAEFQEAFEASQKVTQNKGYKEESPLIKMGRLVRLAAAGRCEPDRMLHEAKTVCPDDMETKNYIQKALEAGVPTNGGFGIPNPLSGRVIEALYPNTLLEKLGIGKIPLSAGRLDMARMDSSSSVGWVGELPTNTPTAPVFGQVSLQAKKLAANCEISNSLLRYNSVSVDSWVAKDLNRKFRIALDTAMLGAGGTQYTPMGLSGFTGVQTIGSSSTALTQTSPRDMIALLKAANIDMTNVSWMMSPQMESWLMNLKTTTGAWIFLPEMTERGTLCGYKYLVSTSVSYTDTSTDYADLWLGDFDYFMWGVGLDMELRMSQDATFVSGGTTYSAFQRDSTLIRVIGEHDFNVMQPKAFVKGIFSVA